jgi:diacylglycerol kinase family enzyme
MSDLQQPLGTPLFLVAHGGEDGIDARTLEQVSLALHRADRQFKLFHAPDRAELAQTARRAAVMAHRYRGMLVAAGGGGTVEAVSREALRVGCLFGVLPQELQPPARRSTLHPA